MEEGCGGIDILINNAGIITSNKTFDLQTEDEILRTMNINTGSRETKSSRAFLSVFILSDSGRQYFL